MASIIQTPTVAPEKRKLSLRTRGARPTESMDAANQAVQAPMVNDGKPAAGAADRADVKELIEQARLSVLAQLKDEADKARELGRQRGLQEGRTAGAEEARKEFATAVARVHAIAEKLEQLSVVGVPVLEEAAVAIAFEAVCKIIGEAAPARETVLGIVREAASHVHTTQRLTIHLHPADLELLQGTGMDMFSILPGDPGRITWIADQQIDVGGVIVTSDAGDLDARLETQLVRLKAALLAARQR